MHSHINEIISILITTQSIFLYNIYLYDNFYYVSQNFILNLPLGAIIIRNGNIISTDFNKETTTILSEYICILLSAHIKHPVLLSNNNDNIILNNSTHNLTEGIKDRECQEKNGKKNIFRSLYENSRFGVVKSSSPSPSSSSSPSE